MVSTSPLSSMTMPEPSRSRPRFLIEVASGLITVLTCTTAETNSSRVTARAGTEPRTSKHASKATEKKLSARVMTASCERCSLFVHDHSAVVIEEGSHSVCHHHIYSAEHLSTACPPLAS